MGILENGETIRGVLVHFTSETMSLPNSIQLLWSDGDSSGVLS